MRGRRIRLALKRVIIGPPAIRHSNGISLAGRGWPNIECWLSSFVIFQGNRTSIARKPYIFVIFQGGGPGSLPLTPLDPVINEGLSTYFILPWVAIQIVARYIPASSQSQGHYRPTSKTPFRWRFAGGLMVAIFFLPRSHRNHSVTCQMEKKITASDWLGSVCSFILCKEKFR